MKAFTKSKNGQAISKSNKYYGSQNPFVGYAPTCTWYAYGRYYEVQGGKIPSCAESGINGNGGAFYGYAKAKGKRKTGKIPKVGAIICWSRSGTYSGQATRGHVAFVEDVKANNVITISENYSSLGYKRAVYDLKPDKQGRYKYYGSYGTFQGFIYQDSNYASSGGGTADHPRSWYINKYGNEAKVYFEMRDMGYSHKGTCAIMGNINQESGFRTTARSNDGYGSQGLCQWTGGRLTNLKNFAKKNHMEWTSVKCQCKFLDKELTDSYKSLQSRLKKGEGTLYQLTYDFCFTFERPSKSAANMERRYSSAKTYYKRYKNAYGGAGSNENIVSEESTGQAGVDMKKRASRLASSDNFEFIDLEYNKESDTDKARRTKAYDFVSKASFTPSGSAAVPEPLVSDISLVSTATRKPLSQIKSYFQLSDALIQAPFIELDLNSYVIGSFKNSLDYYPNYVTNLSVKKINGELNQYTIGLVHQIRAGEDPNLLDRVFSNVRYNKIKIRYGDCTSGSLFKEVEAIITNIVQNRDYASAKINYTLYATSTCSYVSNIRFDFPATIDRPSHILRNLLYNSGEISDVLVTAFPGMSNRTEVEEKNFIPTNDTVLAVDAKSNITLLEYINYLVGCMSNNTNSVDSILRNSNYYITYNDSSSGSYFKITEQSNINSKSAPSISIFDIVVGYPDGNDVLDFNIKEDSAWSLLYNSSNISSEFYSDIDNSGEVVQMYSPSFFNKSNIMNEVQKNWWTQMISHPIKAQLVMRGLLKPVNLMDYINVDVRFFGNKHIASGLYTIISQQDVLDSSGFKTNLDLIRVGSN